MSDIVISSLEFSSNMPDISMVSPHDQPTLFAAFKVIGSVLKSRTEPCCVRLLSRSRSVDNQTSKSIYS